MNPQRAAYNAAALPTELRQRVAGLSRLSGKQVKYVFFILEKKGTNAFAVQNGFPARFVHLLDTTSIARIF